MKRLTVAISCGYAAVALLASFALGAPAELDPIFSDDGKLRTNFTPGFDQALAVAIQPDGKIVAAGRAESSGGVFAVARYTVDGTLDPTFSADGKTTANFRPGDDFAAAVVVLPDGDLVVAGRTAGRNHKFALVRYDADGTPDTAFSGDGRLVTDFTTGDDHAWDVAVQADGKIVAGGIAASGSDGQFAIARYNADGTLDPTFDGDGRVTTNLTARFDAITALAIQPDGKIVAAGAANDDRVFALARYNSDGTLDNTFDGDGKSVTNFTPGHDFAWDVALQPDGKIATSGRAAARFGLARYTADGTLDSTFGGDGRVTTNFTADLDISTGIGLQADGKIVAVGGANNLKFAIARYNDDGSLDLSFGGDGKVTTNLTRGRDYAWDFSLQADGKIVAAGAAGARFGVVRYLGG